MTVKIEMIILAFFIQVTGRFVSGFEDIVSQTGIRKSGIIKVVLLGSGYNHA